MNKEIKQFIDTIVKNVVDEIHEYDSWMENEELLALVNGQIFKTSKEFKLNIMIKDTNFWEVRSRVLEIAMKINDKYNQVSDLYMDLSDCSDEIGEHQSEIEQLEDKETELEEKVSKAETELKKMKEDFRNGQY